MTKTDFEKAAYDHAMFVTGGYANPHSATFELYKQSFLAGCEHAYSIDKETIDGLEKDNKELMEGQDILANDLVKAQGEIDKLHGMWEASERIRKETIERLEKEKEELKKRFRVAITLLRDLADIQNGPPLIREEREWVKIMEETYEFLHEVEDTPKNLNPDN